MVMNNNNYHSPSVDHKIKKVIFMSVNLLELYRVEIKYGKYPFNGNYPQSGNLVLILGDFHYFWP